MARTFVRDRNAQKVAEFNVPYRGTWTSIADNMLQPDMLFASRNVFLRRGKLRERPGLELLSSSVFDGVVRGGEMAVTPQEKVMLAVTDRSLYTLRESATEWVLDTNIAFSNNPIDVTFLETNSEYVAVIADGSNPLRRWIDGEGVEAIVPTEGNVPIAKSVCTAARRIIALIDPHTVEWTSTLTYDNWVPTATAGRIAQTNDDGICVKPIGTLDFVIYKERSIYQARAQAGPDSQAFNIQWVQDIEGPAGVHAVVKADNAHYFMTRNGRIGKFDGRSFVEWIADGTWIEPLQTLIDPEFAHNIFGTFDYRLHCVFFWFPRIGDGGENRGLVMVNLPLRGSGVTEHATFLGETSFPISYGYEMRFNNQIDRSLVFNGTDRTSYNLNENYDSDGDVLFDWFFRTGLQPMPDLKHFDVSVESFLERGNKGFVNVFPLLSDMLEGPVAVTDRSNFETIDLFENPVREYVGFNAPTRFFGLQYEGKSDSRLRYAGAVGYGIFRS